MTKDDAVAWAGGTQTKLAERLGIKQSSISLWGERPPYLRQVQIELLSAGALKAHPEDAPDSAVPAGVLGQPGAPAVPAVPAAEQKVT